MICGVANVRSRAVAERLGFTNEGIRRESYWITDRFADHVVYGLLDREWRREQAGAEL
jgi:ribosomal-protein-serine acetyltransferase